MPLIADTHVHVYPRYDLARFLGGARRNLGGADAAARAQMVLCLAERHDCRFFRTLAAGALSLPAPWTAAATADAAVLAITDGASPPLWLVAGRQIVTRERLEVLALTVDVELGDGDVEADVIDAILDAGGVPVLAWAPGKWFGARGRLVAELLERYPPDRLAIGDSSLRPTAWGTPRLMRRAERLGFPVLAGSDPLPITGEEDRVGTYGVRSDAILDPLAPAASLRARLLGPVMARHGRRGGIAETVSRLRRLRAEAS